MAHLPHDKHRRPVPWFVATINGTPDFRVMKPNAIQNAQAKHLCWVCGVPFQRQEDRVFVIDPMSAANYVSAEPPSHRECAFYSVTACPFLTTPTMARRDRNIPDHAHLPSGTTRENPGIAIIWVTSYRSWKYINDQHGCILFNIGEPKEVHWYTHGRIAIRDEVLTAIASYLPQKP